MSKLKYPFDEFPEDLSTWEECKREHKKALNQIKQLEKVIEERYNEEFKDYKIIYQDNKVKNYGED